MPNYYTDAMKDQINKQQGSGALRQINFKDKDPHIYHFAENCYRDMAFYTMPQSVIITGESGSGKTESTKHIMK
jgi:myosin heavy subunit